DREEGGAALKGETIRTRVLARRRGEKQVITTPQDMVEREATVRAGCRDGADPGEPERTHEAGRLDEVSELRNGHPRDQADPPTRGRLAVPKEPPGYLAARETRLLGGACRDLRLR